MPPKFVYESYSVDGHTLSFHYSAGNHKFTHQVIFENILPTNPQLIFNLGIAEIFSYWKLFCSPEIEIAAGHLTANQIAFWHKLTIKGMGQYFYENRIDFTKKDFLTIMSSSTSPFPFPSPNLGEGIKGRGILIPIGGGKDSVVTYELLKPHFDIRPIIVYPTTPASARIVNNPIIVRRILDPQMLELTKQGYLTGHVPYSAILAFIFLIPQYKYIAVSHERSSDEGNIKYLGHTINHQYSKTLEFETDLNDYIKTLNITPPPPPLKLRGGGPQAGGDIKYFSFLRPLYELQIAELFSKMPQYFDKFRSCNKNQKMDSWCGHCPKCVSTALLLKPFLPKDQITKIIGSYPSESEMRQLTISKPFECVLTKAEAQAALTGEGLDAILSSWLPNPNMPVKFTHILKATLS